MMRAAKALTLSLVLLPLGACISLLPKPPPPPHLYVLEAGEVTHPDGLPINAVISVGSPDGERSILGSDIVWRTGDTIAYVGGMAWTGRADALLQQMVSETLTRQGRFVASVRTGNARSDYDIRWDVLAFEVRDDGTNARAQFSADVKIVETSSRRVIAARIIDTSVDVPARSQTGAAQSLARAAQEGSARIGVFAAESVTQAIADAEARAAAEAAQTSGQSRAASIRR